MMFALRHAAMLPLLRITSAEATKVAEGVYKVEAQIRNTGFLSTNVTQMGVRNKVSRPVVAEIKPQRGTELVIGHKQVELGHLDGRSAKLLLPRVVGGDVIDRTKRNVEWVVKTGGPVDVTVEARCPRAGTHRVKLALE
jgi:hypothetical protein